MSEPWIPNEPWIPDPEPLLEALKLMAAGPEAAGFRCVVQFFVMVPLRSEGGGEIAVGGPLRYTPAKVLKDYASIAGPRTICFAMRTCDPDNPEHMHYYAQHQKAAQVEREGLQ